MLALHDLENLDGPAACTRVLCAATQSMERMYHECNQLREQAATPNEHIEHRFLAMRAGEAAEKLFDLFEQYRELHGTEEQLLAYKE